MLRNKTFFIYWKTTEHLGQVQLAQITPHPSFIYVAVSASRLILMFSSISPDRYPIQSACLTVVLSHTHMKPQQRHNCPQKALCHDKCTGGRDPTHSSTASLLTILFKRFIQQRPSKKRIMIIHHSHSTTLAMLGSPEGRAASLQVVQCC